MAGILDYIEKNPQETQRLVGLEYEQLQQLIKNVEALNAEKQAEQESRKVRIITKGGGRKPKLPASEQILLTLIYLRDLTTFQLLGIQFEVSESTANDTFNYWFPLLRELLPSSLLEQVKKNASDHEIVKEILTQFELIVDSSEQARERPGEYEEQQKYYSGKKKNHTFKNQLIILPKGEDIVDVAASAPGLKSDINFFRERQPEFDYKQKFQGDKGYIGESAIKTPQKQPRNGELTTAQKEKNKELSSERILVEHTIRVVKIFRVAIRLISVKSSKI